MLLNIYETLLKHLRGPWERKYNRQLRHWWPVSGKFRPPQWEICVGAILVQNTNWRNVEKALQNLEAENFTTPENISGARIQTIERLIRPSGFYRQKAKRLKILSEFIVNTGDFFDAITREQLLELHGIGKETADSILLYACNKPSFVVDTYTKRILSRFGIIKKDDYDELHKWLEQSLPRDVRVYKEFHALIVELAKNTCVKDPRCNECPLNRDCDFGKIRLY